MFVLCTLGPLTALAGYSHFRVSGHLRQEAYERQHKNSRSESMQLLRGLRSLEAELEQLCEAAASSPNLPLSSLRQKEPSGDHLVPLEVCVAEPNQKLGGFEYELTADLALHIRSGKTMLFPVAAPNRQTARLFMAREIAPGVQGSVLVCEIQARDLWAFYEGVEEEGDVRAYYCDDLLVACTDLSREPDFPDAPERGEFSSSRFSWKSDAETYLASMRPVYTKPTFGTNLMVSISEPEATVFATVTQFKNIFWLVCLVSFLLALLLSVVLIRKTLGPLELLQVAVAKFAEDRLDSKVEIHTGDELEALGTGFNEMVEKVRERTVELEYALNTKSLFLANMSHELRTPLTSILGFAEMIQSGIGTAKEQESYARTILESGENLLSLVEDVLGLSRLGEGEVCIDRKEGSLVELMNGVMDTFSAQAKQKGLSLELHAEGKLPETIVTDRERLSQILINVIGNAMKFTSEGSVSTRVWFSEADERLSVEVTDTGIGIPAESLQFIFAPFAQVDSSMSRTRGGTGVGLSIAQDLSRALGGEITCSSTEGVGSTFRIDVEVKSAEPTAWVESFDAPCPPVEVLDEQPEPFTPFKPGTRVLIAEDVAVNRLLLASMLRSLGLEVDEAANGCVALDKGRVAASNRCPYALIFMDIQMPQMDGYEATRELRNSGYSAPIAALTAHAVEGEKERCLAAGCDDFVNKPITKAQLAVLVAKHIARASDVPTAKLTG